MNLPDWCPFSELEVYRGYCLILDEPDARRLARQTAEASASMARAQSELAPARTEGSVIVEAELAGGAPSIDLLVALSMLDAGLRVRVDQYLGRAREDERFARYWESRVQVIEEVVEARRGGSSPSSEGS